METKADKFRRIAQSRTNKAIEVIRSLGNLSNASNYEYTSDEVSKIFSTLRKEIDSARATFTATKGGEKPFKL